MENPANNLMEPWDSGPKKEKGNNTAKTLEDSLKGKLANKTTIPPNSNTSKLENDRNTDPTRREITRHAILWARKTTSRCPIAPTYAIIPKETTNP